MMHVQQHVQQQKTLIKQPAMHGQQHLARSESCHTCNKLYMPGLKLMHAACVAPTLSLQDSKRKYCILCCCPTHCHHLGSPRLWIQPHTPHMLCLTTRSPALFPSSPTSGWRSPYLSTVSVTVDSVCAQISYIARLQSSLSSLAAVTHAEAIHPFLLISANMQG